MIESYKLTTFLDSDVQSVLSHPGVIKCQWNWEWCHEIKPLKNVIFKWKDLRTSNLSHEIGLAWVFLEISVFLSKLASKYATLLTFKKF